MLECNFIIETSTHPPSVRMTCGKLEGGSIIIFLSNYILLYNAWVWSAWAWTGGRGGEGDIQPMYYN